ncbi:MAG: hypothetical protein RKP20_08805 [Candidatus Competibacter sp.]|nr:hypothetical protein [Candidatus Competibacter sp.]
MNGYILDILKTCTPYPESFELAAKQAAEVLGVSRPFRIKLLESDTIPFRKPRAG